MHLFSVMQRLSVTGIDVKIRVEYSRLRFRLNFDFVYELDLLNSSSTPFCVYILCTLVQPCYLLWPATGKPLTVNGNLKS